MAAATVSVCGHIPWRLPFWPARCVLTAKTAGTVRAHCQNGRHGACSVCVSAHAKLVPLPIWQVVAGCRNLLKMPFWQARCVLGVRFRTRKTRATANLAAKRLRRCAFPHTQNSCHCQFGRRLRVAAICSSAVLAGRCGFPQSAQVPFWHRTRLARCALCAAKLYSVVQSEVLLCNVVQCGVM